MKCFNCKNRSVFPNEVCPLCHDYDRYEPKLKTNADHIRNMTDKEIEDWYWWMNKKMMGYTDSRMFVHDWLKAPVGEGE